MEGGRGGERGEVPQLAALPTSPLLSINPMVFLEEYYF